MEKSTSFLTIMRYWAYNILSISIFPRIFYAFRCSGLEIYSIFPRILEISYTYLLILLQLFLMFWIEFVCFPWFFGSKIEFWWKSLFFVKKPYFSRPKNPLFTKFSKNTQKSVIMVLLHGLIKAWILKQFKVLFQNRWQ